VQDPPIPPAVFLACPDAVCERPRDGPSKGFHILRQIRRVHPRCLSRSATKLLADHFATAMLMLEQLVPDRWLYLSVGFMAGESRVSELALACKLIELGLTEER
jgi:hypothetical protein